MSVNIVFPHEMHALLEALRRDVRSEQAKAATSSEERDFHLYNAKTSIRLLEALNPKSKQNGQSDFCRKADKLNSFGNSKAQLDEKAIVTEV